MFGQTQWSEVRESVVANGGLADVLHMESGSGEATYALYEKHLESTGCPGWVRTAEQKRCAFTAGMVLLQFVISIMFGTDSGSDEAKTRADVEIATADDTDTFALGAACLLHQLHLLIKKSLTMSDQFCSALSPAQNAVRKYFGTLVKVMHCWRDFFS